MHLEWQKVKFQMEPASRFPTDVLSLLAWGSWVGVFATTTIAVLTIKKNEMVKVFSTLLVSVFFLCICVAWAASRAFFLPRYFIFLTPVVIAITGVGLFEIFQFQKKWIAAAASVLLVIGIALHLPDTYKNTKAPWRQAAQMIWLTPDSVVYTTRTLAMRSPYYESHNIPLIRLEADKKGLQQINKSLDEGKQVWIVENYFGAMTYFQQLKSDLSQELLQLEDFTLTDGPFSEPVLILHVQKPNRIEPPARTKNESADTKTSASKKKALKSAPRKAKPRPNQSNTPKAKSENN
jgi:hypothetical protein